MPNIDALISVEGGYSNNPADTGGPTMYGITEHVARAHGYSGDMRNLPREKAVEIYTTIYWTDPSFDQVAHTAPKLADELFDTGVNMGPGRATMFLQRALNLLNRGASDYPDIAVDGKIGKMTLYCLTQLQAKRDKAEVVLIRMCNSQQIVKYMEFAEAKISQEAFEYGWILNRG